MPEEAELHRHGDHSWRHFSAHGWKKFIPLPMSRVSVTSSDRTKGTSSSPSAPIAAPESESSTSERDPALVAADVAARRVSPDAAAVYGAGNSEPVGR